MKQKILLYFDSKGSMLLCYFFSNQNIYSSENASTENFTLVNAKKIKSNSPGIKKIKRVDRIRVFYYLKEFYKPKLQIF